MAKLFNDILDTIGNTPVVRINKLAPDGAELYVKLEAFNPMGSVKDRMALGVIEQAERDGALQPGQTVVEATSGNTGIGLAMVCATKGYPLVLTMSESFSIERRKILRFLGAQVVLTPAHLKGSGMLAKAVELAKEHGWFLVRQFENEANADAHSQTTAIEILEVFGEDGLDYFVTGYGTGGTLKGIARVLREKSPRTRIIVCEPDNSALLGSGIGQERNPDGSPKDSHPNFRPHLMQGWTPDFIPKLAEDAVAMNLIDEIIAIDGNHAMEMTRELARREGIFCGVSSGATFSGALRVAQKAGPGARILCMLPDTGERYLSTPVFEQVDVEMNDEELAISRSTPNYRFDTPAPPPAPEPKAAAVTPGPQLNEEASVFVERVLADADQPVVLFALEWCEFCWGVRKLFGKLGIPYRSVDLDSVSYQEGNRGGEIRKVLKSRLGTNNIPQIFIGGHHIGGATDLYQAWNRKQVQPLLEKARVSFDDPGPDFDANSFLPAWLHKR
jgi:cysteine synthase A